MTPGKVPSVMENAVDPANHILKTKLFVPRIRKKRVERARLLQQLRLGLDYRLILLSAPAGYGKSTLAASWAGECPYPIAWLSLDANDNSPSRFVKYIATAIQTALPSLGYENLTAFHSFTPLSIQSYLSCLVNQLCDWKDPFFLVLDDYQSINNQDVHELTAFLIEKMPENMHVIIASRIDPPFPLARLRASEQVLEIRTRDIQFNGEEIKDYYDNVMGMRLSQSDLAILEDCTEGWAAGLQMAGLAMQSLDMHDNLPREQFLRSFQGSQRYIMDLFNRGGAVQPAGGNPALFAAHIDPRPADCSAMRCRPGRRCGQGGLHFSGCPGLSGPG
jgi:LuxR family transcriptional regulator, maltose regulon positive regulatory protein